MPPLATTHHAALLAYRLLFINTRCILKVGTVFEQRPPVHWTEIITAVFCLNEPLKNIRTQQTTTTNKLSDSCDFQKTKIGFFSNKTTCFIARSAQIRHHFVSKCVFQNVDLHFSTDTVYIRISAVRLHSVVTVICSVTRANALRSASSSR